MSLGVHPSSSAKHEFQESQNANGSDSVTQNYLEVCQQGHRSVMGCNSMGECGHGQVWAWASMVYLI